VVRAGVDSRDLAAGIHPGILTDRGPGAGLADRIAALVVSSPAGGGTTLRAAVPVDGAPAQLER
jgi:hypothetical protein